MLGLGKSKDAGKSANQSAAGGVVTSKKLAKDDSLNASFILGAIENGVVLVGKNNDINLINPAASKMTGWPALEAVGMDINTVMPLTDSSGNRMQPDQNPFHKALSTNASIRESGIWLTNRGGKSMPISLLISPIADKQGQPTGNVVAVFTDMTKEKEEEDRRSDFISTASHEMRSPLAAIDGYIALALNEKISKVDPNARKYLEKAAASTLHLSELFRDLLTSSKVEDGRLVSHPIVMEFGEVVESVIDGERLKAQKKNLNFSFVISSGSEIQGGKTVRPLYYTYVDPNRIHEVLQNLIDNAIKYTDEGSLSVKLTGDAAVVQVQIQDTGHGIPAEDIPHLFQKFYRVDNSMTRTIGGTGLGLFICKKIVEMYNGKIWVESELGKGSTFFINLPRLTTAQALDLQKRQAATMSPLDNS